MSELNFVKYEQLLEVFPFLPASRAGRMTLIKARGFPAPRYIGANTPVWLASEVSAWVDARPRSHADARLESLADMNVGG
jgi:predicted DNA-binding transcriptional regulator AlpA